MVKHEYADVNDIRLHYVTSGEGKLIMFAHGFPEFWYEWKNQLAEFGRDYQAVALDMRGYNLSSKPDDVEQYRVKHLVEDLRALAEHLGHKKFILVGHDWGGVVAWSFSLYYPEYLEKLVIINAPHPGVFERELNENPAQQKGSQYMLMYRSSQAEQILSENGYARLVNSVLGGGLRQGRFNEEDRKAYIEAWSQPGALTGGLNYYRAAQVGPPTSEGARATSNLTADLPSLTVKVPTLVIWGEKDQALLTGNLEGLDKFVPDLTIKRIPDGSHWVVHEKPALVNAYIRDFIEGKWSLTDDLYEGFAERYDLFFSRFGEHDAETVEFFRRLFTENQVRSVLDCACGTGQDLYLFHSLGCEVFGSDISESMLTQARKNLAACGINAPLRKVDYRELPQHFDRQFDAVMCLSTAIAHMPNEAEVLRAFRSMREVLRDGGILVLTQGTADRQWKEKPRFILAVNNRDFSRLFVIDYHDQGARYNILDIFHGDESNELKVWSTDYGQMLLRDDQERLLKASGFGTIDFYGTYRFDPYDKETSYRLIAVAHK